MPELLEVNYVERPLRKGKANVSGVGFFQGLEEYEGKCGACWMRRVHSSCCAVRSLENML